MNVSHWTRSALSCFAALEILAGCGGSQSAGLPPEAIPQTSIAPDAKNQNLIYVADANAVTVSVYSWYGKLLGTLTGFGKPVGLCSDTNGDVYVADVNDADIVEYAHNGALPIKTLSDAGQDPSSCAVDPKTGNLAVTNILTATGGAGNVAIYKRAKGAPKIYSDLEIHNAYMCGYDDNGNLFVDGFGTSGLFKFGELPAGQTTMKNITVNRSIEFPGAVQWDGKYVAVGDGASEIYQVLVSGTKGKVQGSTQLQGEMFEIEFWIQGGRVVATNENSGGSGDVGIWKYPAGGAATKMFGSFQKPYGITISVAPPK